jgi:hypothetical protein
MLRGVQLRDPVGINMTILLRPRGSKSLVLRPKGAVVVV